MAHVAQYGELKSEFVRRKGRMPPRRISCFIDTKGTIR